MKDLFISYAREDENRIGPIAEALAKEGWSVFWDRTIPIGQTWRSYIGKALEEASCVLVVWSRYSIESEFVPEEAEAAKKRGVYVPVLLDAVEPPLGFTSFQAADLTSWNNNASDPQFTLLKNSIAALISQVSLEEKKLQESSFSSKSSQYSPDKYRKPLIIGGVATVVVLLLLAIAVLLQEALQNRAVDNNFKPADTAVGADPKPATNITVNNDQKPVETVSKDPKPKAPEPVETVSKDPKPAKDAVKADSKIYKTVQIGNQIWMAENLNVSHYRNGDPIPEVKDPKEWAKLKKGAWCYYNNDVDIGKAYGKLYNWYAINDPRGLAPKGWHVPSDFELKELERYLGMSWEASDATGWRGNIGGKLKEKGTAHWKEPNKGATNESGLRALAGGGRSPVGKFSYFGVLCYFWSSSENGDDYAWYRVISHDNTKLFRDGSDFKRCGFSIRCIRE